MDFADMDKAVANMVQENSTKEYTPSTQLSNKFSHLNARKQAEVMTKLSKEHEKTIKAESKNVKTKKKDPDAPKREASDYIKLAKQMYEEAGGASKVKYGDMLTLASKRWQEMKLNGEVAVKNKIGAKMASQPTITNVAARDRMTAAIQKAVPVVEEEELVEETLDKWQHPDTKKLYWKSKFNECWVCNPRDHSRGAWMGIYNPVSRKFDPADEPDI